MIHTVDFVRSRSAFLFTSIAAASALFSPSLEALYKRLSNHRQKLASLIVANRYKSVEIVLAFMVCVPWISAGEHWADDETSTYISMALMIALDLSLNKVILTYPDEPRTPRESVATSEFTDGTGSVIGGKGVGQGGASLGAGLQDALRSRPTSYTQSDRLKQFVESSARPGYANGYGRRYDDDEKSVSTAFASQIGSGFD